MPEYIYKRFSDALNQGDLFRIKETGEILVYDSMEGGANWSSYVNVVVAGKIIVQTGCLWVHQIERIDNTGKVIKFVFED